MSEIRLESNILKASGGLYWDNEEEFVLAVEKLLNSGYDDLTIDISEVQFLFSPFMSHLVRFCLSAKDSGKNPSVVIGPNLAQTFESSGLVRELPITCRKNG